MTGSFGIIYTSSLYSVISMLPINIQVDAVDTHFARDKQPLLDNPFNLPNCLPYV